MHATLERRLADLWAGVDPHPVVAVVRAWQARDPVGSQAVLQAIAGHDGPRTASRLMEPVADALAWSEPVQVLDALDALVRAGGDPSRVLDRVGACMAQRRTRVSAARVLTRAAWNGWSLTGIELPVHEHAAVQRVHRLAALEQVVDVRRFGRVAREQPVANLSEGIGLVEAQLLELDRVAVTEARVALDGLEAAGADLGRAWLAMVPVLERQLTGDRGGEAAGTIAQLSTALRYTAEGPEVRQAVLGRSGALIRALADVLPRKAHAARAIRVLVGEGADLQGVVSAVEGGMSHPLVQVRRECSMALSTWRVRCGDERPLERGCSHRRVHAQSEVPLEGEALQRCGACGHDGAVVLYRHEDIGQTHADVLIETRCPRCGLYCEQRYGY